MKRPLGIVFFLIGLAILIFSLFWFRTPVYEPLNNQRKEKVYRTIVIFFLDAIGVRHVNMQQQDRFFHTIDAIQNLMQKEPENSFLTPTYAVPPSTDFTIMAIINGVIQRANYLDVIFKTSPQQNEASLVKRQISSLLITSKKQDWFKMGSGEFSYVTNTADFNVSRPLEADQSSKDAFSYMYQTQSYELIICHYMGYDALGHALHLQDRVLGKHLIQLYNAAILEGTKNLREDDLFIAIGDHDQSYRGKHYQCSVESTECQGWIFAYSKRGLKNNRRYQHYWAADIAATIGTLLGFETLNQNMGKIISQFYPSNYSQSNIDNEKAMVIARMIKYLQLQNATISSNFIEELKTLDPDDAMEAAQWQIQYGLPNKNLIFAGVSLISLGLLFVTSMNLPRKDEIKEALVLVAAYFFSGYIYLVYLFFNGSKRPILRKLFMISIVGMCLSLNDKLASIRIEALWLLFCVAKLLFFKKFISSYNPRFKFLAIIVLISQTTAYSFFLVNRDDFETRMRIAKSLLILIVILALVDPRYFNREKNKALYMVILFCLADTSSVLQLNEQFNFIQFVVFFSFAEAHKTEFNICLALAIQSFYNPLLIVHSEFPTYKQVNNNALIILDKEFAVIPSLITIFLSYYGIIIVALSTLLISKGALTPFLLQHHLIIIIHLFQLSIYVHSKDSDVERPIFTLFKVPLLLVQYLFLFVMHMIQEKKYQK